MAAIKFATILFATFVSAMLIAPVVPLDFGHTVKNGYGEMAKSLSSSKACIVSQAKQFDQCNKRIEDFVNKDRVESSEMKEFCCSYVAYKDCVDDIAKRTCGDQAAQTVEVFMSTLKNKLMSGNACDSYSTIFDCMDQMVVFAVESQ